MPYLFLILGPPRAPQEFSVLSVTAVSVTLSWISNFNGGSPQTFSVQYRTKGSEWPKMDQISWIVDPGFQKNVTFEVKNLNQRTLYEFRCRAISNSHNEVKISNYTKLALIHTKGKYSSILSIPSL